MPPQDSHNSPNDTLRSTTVEKDTWGFRDYSTRASEMGRTLRTWLVAYGIGGPVLFLTRPELQAAIKISGRARFITLLFLSGVAVQVFNAFLNKWLSWFRSELLWDPNNRRWIHFRVADRLHRFYWFDIACDAWAITAFRWATIATLRILL